MSFFLGFGDELVKLAGPVDWIKQKLGYGKPAPVTPKLAPTKPTYSPAGKALRDAPSGYKRMLRVLGGKPPQ